VQRSLRRTRIQALTLHRIRRIAIIAIIVSLSITALIGIVTILTGTGGDIQSKIILSTLVIGLFSVLALCDLAVFNRRYRVTGFLGIAAAVVALAMSLILIWGDWAFADTSNTVWKTLWVATIIAVSLAHASLLIPVVENRQPAIRLALYVELGLVAFLAILLLLLVLTDANVSSDAYTRLVAVVAILDVLGTIVVPVLARLLRDRVVSPGAADAAASVRLTLDVPRAVADQLASVAAEQSTTPEQVALSAISASLTAK
jgi:hypothetical protein